MMADIDVQAQPKQMLLGADIIKPAAQAAPQGQQGEEEPKDRAWLRNLVCGFDMEIPAERLQQDTVGESQPHLLRLHPHAQIRTGAVTTWLLAFAHGCECGVKVGRCELSSYGRS